MRKVLIFRLGSLGDTLVALPALRLIASAFSDAERIMLTHSPADPTCVAPSSVLEGSGLVHGYITYASQTRAVGELLRLRRKIRALRPEILIYLAESRGFAKTLRDIVFFRACGIRQFVGVPISRALREHRDIGNGLYEPESERLLRTLQSLRTDVPSNRLTTPFQPSDADRRMAQSVLQGLDVSKPIFVMGIGARFDMKDWGLANWSSLLLHLGSLLSGWSVVLIGDARDRQRGDKILSHWTGNKRNLCGDLTIAQSGAVLEHARLFVGHDGGAMHLAASVGTTCVAVFSAMAQPGVWFPEGRNHRVVYPKTRCATCQLATCVKTSMACIRSIQVEDVAAQVEAAVRDLPSVP